MLSSPHYAPFKEGELHWSMGLEALDLRDWIEVDDHSDAQLGEKQRLLDEQHGAVFDALPESRDGSEEVLALLIEHLPGRFPDVYRRDGDEMVHLPGSRRWPLTEGALHPPDLGGADGPGRPLPDARGRRGWALPARRRVPLLSYRVDARRQNRAVAWHDPRAHFQLRE